MPNLVPNTPFLAYEKQFGDLDLTLTEAKGFEIVSLAAAQGTETEFAKLFKKSFGVVLPKPGRWNALKTGKVLWTGQNQYFLFSNEPDDRLDEKLGTTFDGLAYATLQTDGWAALKMSGSSVHSALDRFIPLDIRNAEIGFGARTSAHHMSVFILKTGDESFVLLTPRSSSAAFLEALEHVIHNVQQETKLINP